MKVNMKTKYEGKTLKEYAAQYGVVNVIYRGTVADGIAAKEGKFVLIEAPYKINGGYSKTAHAIKIGSNLDKEFNGSGKKIYRMSLYHLLWDVDADINDGETMPYVERDPDKVTLALSADK